VGAACRDRVCGDGCLHSVPSAGGLDCDDGDPRGVPDDEGIFELVGWSRVRPVAGSVWLLVDGVVPVILSLVIWWHLAGLATWVIGTLLGFAMLFSGGSRLMLAMAGHRAARLTA